MRSLWTILGRRRPAYLWLLTASVLDSAAEALLHTLMLKWIFDEAVIAQDFRRFLQLSLAYLGLGLAGTGISYALVLWQKALVNRVVLELEGRLLENSLALDWQSFSRQGAGAFVSRVHRDTFEGLTPALGLIVTVTSQGLAALTFVGVLLYLSWQATLALLLVAPPLLLVARWVGGKVRQATGEEREGEARYLEVLTLSLKAFRALRGLPRLGPRTQTANQEALGAYLDGTYRSQRLLQSQQAWNDVFMNLANATSLIVGGYYVLVRELSFGGFLAFVNAFWRAVNNTFTLLRKIPEFHRYAEILRRSEELLSHTPSPYAHPSPVARLEGVRLSYDGKPALELPNLEIRPGERILLLGPNGAGKTTLLHILSGYLAPELGKVELPERVASLTAPVELPPLPVNTMISDPPLLRELELEEVASQFPETLSTGQKQRAAIGALLSHQADLYVLDEPLANLDAQSREGVLELILRKTRGKALITVLHGDEDLHGRFDRVVSLAGGRALGAG
jgi:ATP-binding cassette subfamily B protein